MRPRRRIGGGFFDSRVGYREEFDVPGWGLFNNGSIQVINNTRLYDLDVALFAANRNTNVAKRISPVRRAMHLDRTGGVRFNYETLLGRICFSNYLRSQYYF